MTPCPAWSSSTSLADRAAGILNLRAVDERHRVGRAQQQFLRRLAVRDGHLRGELHERQYDVRRLLLPGGHLDRHVRRVHETRERGVRAVAAGPHVAEDRTALGVGACRAADGLGSVAQAHAPPRATRPSCRAR